MATAHCSTRTQVPAAAYIRMSGRQQDKSPAEQRAEITKLATREGFSIVEWFTDEAITGDSSTSSRPGLAALLTAAKAGTFKVVLAWHTNRVSREDPMDAIVFYNQVRKAGVGLHTCCEGPIDLEDFAKQLLLFINQKASNDFLIEMSAKTLRGRIANAKAGGHNGGPAVYGMERGLFRDDGHLVRRLQTGEYVRQAGHRVHLLPGTDQVKIDAVRFAFRRFDAADIGVRDLARQLEAKGYPSPNGKGWTHDSRAPAAADRGLRRHGPVGHNGLGQIPRGAGRQHRPDQRQRQAPGKAMEGPGRRHYRRWCPRGHHPRRPVQSRPAQATVTRGEALPALPPRRLSLVRLDLLRALRPAHVRQLPSREGSAREQAVRVPPVHLQHLRQPQRPEQRDVRPASDRRRAGSRLAGPQAPGSLPGARPGRPGPRDQDSNSKAKPRPTAATWSDCRRGPRTWSGKSPAWSEAIRTLDAAELVEELALVQAERDRVKAEIVRAGRFTDPVDLDSEAERIADGLWEIGEHLNDSDPAVLREVLRQFVSRITCRWETSKSKSERQTRCRLVGGTVELREQTPLSVCGAVAQAT